MSTGTPHQISPATGETVTANQGTPAADANAWPVKPGDGTRSITTLFDADSGAGSQWVQGVSLRKAAGGGSVEAGTATDPLRVDPTGTTQQPTSSAVASQADGHSATLGATADADTANTLIGRTKKIVSLLNGGLPAALGASGGLKASLVDLGGAALDATVAAVRDRLPAALVGGRLDVTIGASPTTLPTSSAAASQVDGHSASLGATTDAEAVGNGSLIAVAKRVRTLLSGGLPAALSAGGGLKVGVVDALPMGTNSIGGVTSADGADVALGATTDADTANTAIGRLKKIVGLLNGGLPAALGTGGGLKASLVDLGGAATDTVLQAVRDRLPAALVGGRLDVTLGAAPATVTTSESRPATSAVTSVAGSASSVTLLASNANRRGAVVHNDSTAILYVKLGATASTSSFSYRLGSQDTLEIPQPCYTGIIDGIWDSATGNARVTELT